MSITPSDLALFPKKIRSKIRLSIRMSRIMHFMYLALKNFPKVAESYENIDSLLNDLDFAKAVLARERRIKEEEVLTINFAYFYDIYKHLLEKNFSTAIDVLNTVWRISTCGYNEAMKIIYKIVGLDESASMLERFIISRHLQYSVAHLCYQANNVSLIFLELERGHTSDSLSKLSVYMGTLMQALPRLGVKMRLGLAARFSIKTQDADVVSQLQTKGFKHVLSTPFYYYPALLRLCRVSYRKMNARKSFDIELKEMLSELYLEADEAAELVSGEARANVFLTIPSISVNGGLCILASFKGRLTDPLIEKSRIVLDEDVKFKVYPSYNSLLSVNKHPGEYVFLVAMPITAPGHAVVLGNWRLDDMGDVRKNKRGAKALDYLFPKINELIRKNK